MKGRPSAAAGPMPGAHRRRQSPMSPMLMFASLAITGALIFYTVGVFRERADGSLRFACTWLREVRAAKRAAGQSR